MLCSLLGLPERLKYNFLDPWSPSQPYIQLVAPPSNSAPRWVFFLPNFRNRSSRNYPNLVRFARIAFPSPSPSFAPSRPPRALTRAYPLPQSLVLTREPCSLSESLASARLEDEALRIMCRRDSPF